MELAVTGWKISKQCDKAIHKGGTVGKKDILASRPLCIHVITLNNSSIAFNNVRVRDAEKVVS